MGELDNKNGDTSCIGVTADMGDNAGGKIGGPFIGINGKSFCKSGDKIGVEIKGFGLTGLGMGTGTCSTDGTTSITFDVGLSGFSIADVYYALFLIIVNLATGDVCRALSRFR